ncbi:MAG: hypothetical protein BGN88_03135 [Clostridiales bacterium 43-6]|nr:MAG: hypothetical protein BGN88_03135 [Clostridiales bacterium 43-6]
MKHLKKTLACILALALLVSFTGVITASAAESATAIDTASEALTDAVVALFMLDPAATQTEIDSAISDVRDAIADYKTAFNALSETEKEDYQLEFDNLEGLEFLLDNFSDYLENREAYLAVGMLGYQITEFDLDNLTSEEKETIVEFLDSLTSLSDEFQSYLCSDLGFTEEDIEALKDAVDYTTTVTTTTKATTKAPTTTKATTKTTGKSEDVGTGGAAPYGAIVLVVACAGLLVATKKKQ